MALECTTALVPTDDGFDPTDDGFGIAARLNVHDHFTVSASGAAVMFQYRYCQSTSTACLSYTTVTSDVRTSLHNFSASRLV